MIVTTTTNVDGRAIREYLGIITAHALVRGDDVGKGIERALNDLFAAGKTSTTEHPFLLSVETAANEALATLSDRGRARGADAMVGVQVAFEGARGVMVLVIATGNYLNIA
jgi:uncharacterized protein YbjQ (UPF0145 family)